MIYNQIEYGFETAIAAEPIPTKVNVDHGFVEDTGPSNLMTISYQRLFKRSPF